MSNDYYRGILELNTQVRRLQVVSAFVQILGREALSEKALLARLFRWSASLENSSSAYQKMTGRVTIDGMPKPEAARRYLSFVQSIGLIAKTSEMYRNTRLGLTLFPFLKDIVDPVFLSNTQKLFFGYLLLLHDADITLTIINQMMINPALRLSEYQQDFQAYHIERLNIRIKNTAEEPVKRALLERRLQINKWRKPKEYPEHIVPPRINWMLDIGWIEDISSAIDNRRLTKRYQLSDNGAKFFSGLPLFEYHQYNASIEWIREGFFSHFADICGGRRPIEKDEFLEEYIYRSFVKYRQAISFQVPLLQVVIHSLLNIFRDKNVIYNYNEIAEWLQSDRAQTPDGMRYLVRSTAREAESYILLSTTHSS